VDQLGVLDVIEVQGDRHRSGRGQLGQSGGERAYRAAVKGNRVLAHLQDHRVSGVLGSGHDRLGVFEGDDVEGRHRAVARTRVVNQFGCGSQWHRCSRAR